jgi:hypothetical protein
MTRLPAGCFAALALLVAGDVDAYCRTSTCDNKVKGARCVPEGTRQEVEPPPDCGTPLYWNRPCFGFAVDERGSRQIGATDARAALMAAFAAWEAADCGGAGPSIAVEDLGEVACDAVEYNPEAGNVNVLVFRDDEWPHEGSFNTLALTTVSFEVGSGEIFDADIEVNSASRTLTVTQTTTDFDLISILTHEAGHALGLAHSDAVDAMGEEATMTPVVSPGSTSFRSLTGDDIAGVCAAYAPAEAPAESCNPIPRHGFSPECRADQTHGDCAAAAGPGDARAALALLVAVAAMASWRRRTSAGGRPVSNAP